MGEVQEAIKPVLNAYIKVRAKLMSKIIDKWSIVYTYIGNVPSTRTIFISDRR